MTYRTVIQSDFESCIKELRQTFPEAPEEWDKEVNERKVRLVMFPYAVVLQVSYPELDFANRWCWQNFGPAHGECDQAHSEYPVCNQEGMHSHTGQWLSHWIMKTAYDFGFNEWYFANQAERDQFVAYVPQINFGEKFPKK